MSACACVCTAHSAVIHLFTISMDRAVPALEWKNMRVRPMRSADACRLLKTPGFLCGCIPSGTCAYQRSQFSSNACASCRISRLRTLRIESDESRIPMIDPRKMCFFRLCCSCLDLSIVCFPDQSSSFFDVSVLCVSLIRALESLMVLRSREDLGVIMLTDYLRCGVDRSSQIKCWPFRALESHHQLPPP